MESDGGDGRLAGRLACDVQIAGGHGARTCIANSVRCLALASATCSLLARGSRGGWGVGAGDADRTLLRAPSPATSAALRTAVRSGACCSPPCRITEATPLPPPPRTHSTHAPIPAPQHSVVTGEPLQVRATLSIPRGSAENTEQHLQCCACCWASEVWWAPCRRHLVPPAWRPAQAVTKAQQLQCCCGWCDPPLRVCAGPAGMRNRHLECILPGWKETPMPGRDCSN